MKLFLKFKLKNYIESQVKTFIYKNKHSKNINRWLFNLENSHFVKHNAIWRPIRQNDVTAKTIEAFETLFLIRFSPQ